MEERKFPAEPIMVSEARRLAAETFAAWGMLDEQAELACLLVSEVVTNVVLHTSPVPAPRRELVPFAGPFAAPTPELLDAPPGPPDDDGWSVAPELRSIGTELRRRQRNKEFRLRLRRGAGSIWVEVFDSDLRLPRIRSAGATDEGGRGLYLVDQLATRWGSRPTPDGKAVWFELPLGPLSRRT
jgi:hypothetical protein